MKKTPMVLVSKSLSHGDLPAYIQLAHRHLEKAMPEGETTAEGVSYRTPVDLLRIPCGDLANGIEEVTLVYAKAGK